MFPVAGFVFFLKRSPGRQIALKRRSGKALAVTRHKIGSAPAVLARRRCACAGLRDCVVFPIAGFVFFLKRSPGRQIALKRRSGKALAVTRHKIGSAPAVLARRRCACAGLRDCVVFPIAGFVFFLKRSPGRQIALKRRSGKALAVTRHKSGSAPAVPGGAALARAYGTASCFPSRASSSWSAARATNGKEM
ncbi:Uncharacterised protein [Klebsiella pneumoniae]|nr:Uncharacterised protein [Klebsiella pneumoniae]